MADAIVGKVKNGHEAPYNERERWTEAKIMVQRMKSAKNWPKIRLGLSQPGYAADERNKKNQLL